MHKAATPRLAPVRFKAYSRVTRILHPDAPIGCPRAIAPPLTFTLKNININQWAFLVNLLIINEFFFNIYTVYPFDIFW